MEIEESSFGDHVKKLIQLREKKMEHKDTERTLKLTMDEVNWFVISGGSKDVVGNHYQPMIKQLKNKLEDLCTRIEDFENDNLDKGTGPSASSLDVTFKSLCVERHCHKLLRVSNIYFFLEVLFGFYLKVISL